MNIELVMELIHMSYWLTFLVAAGGTLYFILERSSATAAMKTVYTTAGFVAFLTAIQYYAMRDMVGFDGTFSYPTEYRFVGWMVIFPALILMAQKFIGMDRSGTAMRTAFAAFIMVFAAWLCEFQGYGWVGFWLSVLAWGYMAYHVHHEFSGKIDDYKKYITLGWAIIPLGALAHVMQAPADSMMWREAFFCFTDLFLVLGFCHRVVTHDRKK